MHYSYAELAVVQVGFLYWLANRIGVGRLGSNLLGALCVGILGLVFARIKKCPVTVFNIPGVVPLVPGVPAYQQSVQW